MGLADVFGTEERVQVKFSTFYEMMKSCCETEILMRGINCDVPHKYLREMLSGKKEVEESEVVFPVQPQDPFAFLFETEEEMKLYAIADKDHQFVLTDEGYLHTPAHLRNERSVGNPVPGFEDKVPLSWLDSGYVVLSPVKGWIEEKDLSQEDDLK